METFKTVYSPFWIPMSLLLILGIFGRGMVLFTSNIIGYLVDHLSQQRLPHILNSFDTSDFMLLLSGLTFFGFLTSWFFRVGFSRLSALAVSQFYDEMTLRTSRYPMNFFDRNPTGRIITRFSSDYTGVFRMFGGPLAEFLSIIFDLIWIVVLISTASPYFFPVVALVILLDYGIWYGNRQELRRRRRELSSSRAPSVSHFAETAQGAPTIRTFLQQKNFSDRFDSLDQLYLDKRTHVAKKILSFSIQLNFSTALLLLLTGGYSIILLNKGLISLGSVGVTFGLVTLSGNSLQMFFDWLAQLEEALVGVERMDHYLRLPIEPFDALPSTSLYTTDHEKYTLQQEDLIKTGAPLIGLTAAQVSFNKVSFRYADHLPWVLKNISFEVQAGERFGIIGRTGSGKSTLIQTLFHMYPIQSGEIRIQGYTPGALETSNPSVININTFRRSMSFISQEPILFQGSLWDNLDMAHQIHQEKILQVLNVVGLKDWATPQGLQIHIEERGRNLSQGERQLICMARCILQKSPIVIMDEATSSVDPQSEEILVRATEDFFRERTQIIIAHRLSTLLRCDRILWLHQGEIRALGKPSGIMPQFTAAPHL